MAYWDTSCLLKLYVPEKDSALIRAYLLEGVNVVTSEITRLEFWAALVRKEKSGDLNPGGARKALAAYDADVAAQMILVKPISAAVAERFEAIMEQSGEHTPAIWLRTLDGIHIATAADAAESEMVATDKRLREAASKFNFVLYPR